MKLCTCGSCSKRSVCGLGWRTNARVHSTISLVAMPKRSLTWLTITAPLTKAPAPHDSFEGAVGGRSGSPRSQNNPAIAPTPSPAHGARDRREQMLVRRVLRASGVRVRNPDRAQAEHVGKADVG